MKLSKFVEETLTQIVDGVADAIEKAEERGAMVNPQPTSISGVSTHRGQPIRTVSFDVALSISEESGGQAGVGVFAGAFGLGGRSEASRSESSLSRVQFEVPVALPLGKKT